MAKKMFVIKDSINGDEAGIAIVEENRIILTEDSYRSIKDIVAMASLPLRSAGTKTKNAFSTRVQYIKPGEPQYLNAFEDVLLTFSFTLEEMNVTMVDK